VRVRLDEYQYTPTPGTQKPPSKAKATSG